MALIGHYATAVATAALPLLSSPARARRIRRTAAVHAYVGANGSGKSLTAAYDTLPTLGGVPWRCDEPGHWHTREGVTDGWRRVLSTMRFVAPDGADHPLWDPLSDWRDLVRAEHCDLILDEVAGVASSRESQGLPTAVAASLQELRRRDVLCRWTAPSWDRADKVIREVSQAVTLCVGFAPRIRHDRIDFDGPHEFCDVGGAHQHDSHRAWPERRLSFARTYDASVMTEWTNEKRERISPLTRTLVWVPTSAGARAYDTHAYVAKLGQVTDAGLCMDCGGRRRALACVCDGPTTARRRALPAAAGSTDVLPSATARRRASAEHGAAVVSG